MPENFENSSSEVQVDPVLPPEPTPATPPPPPIYTEATHEATPGTIPGATPEATPPPLGSPAKSKAKPFAIAALIIGIVSIILGAIPIVNFVVYLPAIAGIVLGIVSIVFASKEKSSKGMGIAGVVLSGLSIILSIVITVILALAVADYANSSEGQKTLNNAFQELKNETAKVLDPKNNVSVAIDGADLLKDSSGKDVIVIDFTFTNNDEGDNTFIYSVDTKVFQDGVELTPSAGVKGYDPTSTSKAIKNGKSIKCQMAFLLENKSDVEVECKSRDYGVASVIFDKKVFEVK